MNKEQFDLLFKLSDMHNARMEEWSKHGPFGDYIHTVIENQRRLFEDTCIPSKRQLDMLKEPSQ